MKNLAITLLLLLSFFLNHALAASDIRFQEGEITFSLPDEWNANGVLLNRSPPKMDPTDPLFVSWKRAVITGKDGAPVSAGLNVTVFNVPPDTNVVLASTSLMRRRGWPFKQFLTAEKDGLRLPNSLGYLTEFSPRENLLLKVFVVHAVNNSRFVEVNISATDDIFPQVESELRAILRSLNVAK